MKDKVYVLCVDLDMEHTPESIVVKCDVCGKSLWMSPWNTDKTPVCIECLKSLDNLEEMKLVPSKRDYHRAQEYIRSKHGQRRT